MDITEIPNWPGYGVDEEGRAYSRWCFLGRGHGWHIGTTWRLSKLTRKAGKIPKHGGKPYICAYAHLNRNKKCYKVAVARLVLETFVGPCPPGMEARHLDGDSTNNHRGNLAWGTKIENMQDRQRHGTTMQGEWHHRAKLREDDIRKIRAQRSEGKSVTWLANKHGVLTPCISQIVNRKTWKHVS